MSVRVAIVDDHYVVRFGIGHILSHAEGIVFAGESESAQEIEKFVAKARPAVLLMDVRMPEMDGLEATAAIRAMDREDAGEIPIIALTANAFDEDVQRSMQAGMDAHLTKPIQPEVLYETLESLIKG